MPNSSKNGVLGAGFQNSPQDTWIAATALGHQLPLVTYNVKDFQDIPDLRLNYPFSARQR